MLENFEVKPLFEGQVHERHQFTLNVQGDEFQGVYHEGEIHWFHPQPKQHLEHLENKVDEVMSDYLD